MKKLSKAQIEALERFSAAGGHGYGEYAYLSKATAKALAKRGLVELGTSLSSRGERLEFGVVTEAGLETLNKNRPEYVQKRQREYSSLTQRPYGWLSKAEYARQWDELSRRLKTRMFRKASHARLTTKVRERR